MALGGGVSSDTFETRQPRRVGACSGTERFLEMEWMCTVDLKEEWIVVDTSFKRNEHEDKNVSKEDCISNPSSTVD